MKKDAELRYKLEPFEEGPEKEKSRPVQDPRFPSRRPVILTGYKGSGKTVISEFLETRRYTRVNFADPLKRMLMKFGLTWAQVYGREKETPSDLLGGKTPRWAMQSLGTEWGRKCIDQGVWIRAWEKASLGKYPFVVDDCRFANEVAAVRSLYPEAVIIRVVRPGYSPIEQLKGAKAKFFKAFPGLYRPHSSEASIPSLEVDYEIKNDRSIDDLVELVSGVLSFHEERRSGGKFSG